MTLVSEEKHSLIGKRFPIGEHGWIELLDFMGSDQEIAEAAWVSTELGSVKKSPVPQLLDYLIRHKHWSPFEMCEVKFRVYLPLAVEAQWATHRTASKNQASARYVELPDENFTPTVWRSGSTGHNKQGSGAGIEQQELAGIAYAELVEKSKQTEQYLRELGVAPELARLTQLQSQFTMKVWKMDLRNLMNFLLQRTDSHAQEEIRVYANVINHILYSLFPLAMTAWNNHVKYAITFSLDEQRFLAEMLKNSMIGDASFSEAVEHELENYTSLRTSRKQELLDKLQLILNS